MTTSILSQCIYVLCMTQNNYTFLNEQTDMSFNFWTLWVLYIGQAFRYSPDKTFYIFNQQIYFII